MRRQYPAVSIFGVPTDVGAGRRGASMGPEALRVAGLAEALAARGIDVIDRGNLEGPRNPWTGPVEGYRHLDEVVAWNRAVLAAATAELRLGRMPVMLGGDHCLAMGSIAAVANHCRDTGKTLRILWLDAHTDFNTHAITPSGNVHGMPVACLCGIGPEALTRLGGTSPAIVPAQLRQIGIRSVDPEEKRLVHEHGLDIYDMRYIDEVGCTGWTGTPTCTSASTWTCWTRRSRPAPAPPCPAASTTAKPSW
jgi:arginase